MQTRAFVITLALLLAPLAAQEKHTLRYAFKPGTTAWSLMDQEMTQDMDMGGQKMHMSMASSMWMESKVTGIEKGVASIDNRYARIKIKSDAPGMKVDYDSDVEDSRPGPMRAMADLVGKTATLRADERGKIVEMKMPEGLDEDIEKISGSLKTGMEQSFVQWPEGPVAIGDTWQSHLEIPMQQMGTMKATVTNKLAAVEGDKITLGVTMSFDTSGLQMPGGMTMKAKDTTGSMTVSTTSMMPIESTMTTIMEMGKGDAVVMTMTMKQTMKQVPAPAPKAEPKKEGAGK